MTRAWLQFDALPPQVAVEVPPIIAALVAAVCTMTVLVLVYRRTHEEWLAWLAAAWAFWIIRYLLGFLPTGLWPLGDPRQGMLLLARDGALAMAMRLLGARRLTTGWLLLMWPALVVTARQFGGVALPAWYGWYIFTLEGLLWCAAGVVLARSDKVAGMVRVFAAAGFLGQGVSIAAMAWTGGDASVVMLTLALSSMVHLSVAVGIAVGVQQRLHDAYEAAERSRMAALELVVRGIVRICSYCRAVSDGQGHWTPLADLVTARRATHGPVVRCPECEARQALAGDAAGSV